MPAVVTSLVVAVPTDLVNTPLSSRSVPVTWWAWPALLVTAVLVGLLFATYVAVPGQRIRCKANGRAESRAGVAGGVLSLPAATSVALLGWALRRRLRGERSCPVPATVAPAGTDGVEQ